MSARPTVAVSVALVTLLLAQAAAFAPLAAAAVPASYDAERARFIAEMVDRHGFDASELTELMAEARYQQDIVDAMNRPYEEKAWGVYRRLFVTPERIAGGQRFLAQHEALLAKAEAAYGVPPEVIVAIIGIETNYGQTLGPHRVIDALTTLGFAYPRRAPFFRKELEHFLLLARDEELSPASVRGSYAGAVGRPQFIPSSYRAYAVDFDGDGRRDLWASDADVIGSVGAYLAQHGWRRGEPIASPAKLSRPPGAEITIGGKRPVVPEVRVEQLEAAGVKPAEPLDRNALGALIELDNGGSEYWVTLENFYAITRYNHSNLYALAALQLSEAIAGEGEDGGD